MYDLEIEKVKDLILKNKAKKVLLQLPDGLKPRSKEIVDSLRKDTDAEVFIWAASCFGACDHPVDMEDQGMDLMISWGHSKWR